MLNSISNFMRPPTAMPMPQAPVVPAAMPGLDGAGSAAPAAKSAAPFGDMLDNFVSDVNGKMNAASNDQTKLLSGDTTNLHQAMISLQEANTAFSLMVEVRNKLVDGYQELMRMQI